MRALFGKPGIIYHPSRIRLQLGRHSFSQSLPNWVALPRTLPDELLHGLHVSLWKPGSQRLDGFPFAIQQQAAHVYLAPMAPLTPPHRFQQVHKKLLQPLPTTHRLGIGHAQTYQPFSALSILNVVILSDAGYDVDEAEPPSIMEPARGWLTVLLTEFKATLGPIVEQSGTDEIRRIFGWYYEIGKILDFDDYRAGLADRTRMMRAWNVFLDTYPLVLTPFLMRSTYPWNYDALGLTQTKDLFDSAIYSYGVNYLGLPAGVVPVDLVEDLPAGVQLVGRRFREDVILDAVAAIEQCAGCLVNRLWARIST